MTPDGVQKGVSDSPLDGCALRPEIPGVLVIDGLDREHNAALDQILSYMGRISLGKSSPSLAPLARPVTPLVDARPDPGVNKILDVEQVTGVIPQFVLHAHRAPLGGLTSEGCVRL